MAQVIVEVCQNHNGDVEILKDMVAQAAEAGATWIKMQTIVSDDLTHRPRFDKGADENGNECITRPFAPEYERMKGLDLPEDAHEIFAKTCREHGALPMTTVFSRGRLPLVRRAGMAGVKVASYDCASYPLLRELRDAFEFLVVSTGATYDNEIARAADILKGRRFAFLHCVTSYPTTMDMLHLRRMLWLRQFAPLVGFSDHSLVERDGILASKVALWFGADLVERHFTILDAKATKDGPVSITPKHVKELVEFANAPKCEQTKEIRRLVPDIEPMLGQAQREMSKTELLNRDYYRGRFATRKGDGWLYNWQDAPTDAC